MAGTRSGPGRGREGGEGMLCPVSEEGMICPVSEEGMLCPVSEEGMLCPVSEEGMLCSVSECMPTDTERQWPAVRR